MLRDDILEKIFSHPEAQKVHIGCQATMLSVIDEIIDNELYDNPEIKLKDLTDFKEVNENATIY